MASIFHSTRRSLLSTVQICKRGITKISDLADEIQGENFFNRESEMAALDKLLRPRRGTGRLLILSGPRDSGKSAILREFRRRQNQGQYPGTSCIADLRNVGSVSPAGVARMFKSSFLTVKSLKGSFELATAKGNLELELQKIDQAEDMDNFLSAIRSYGLRWRHVLKGGDEAGFPTIIIDEANRLHSWAADDAGRKNLEQLLAFLIMVTKQEGIMNAVLASSENFFREWIEGFIGHRATLMNIGDLPEEEARRYLDKLIAPKVISEELWRDVFHQLGGRMGLLVQFASLTDEWDQLKIALAASYRRELMAALVPDAIEAKKKPSPPKWSKDDWITVMKALVEHEDGVVPYEWLCDKLPLRKVNSLVEYDLLHYRPYTAWGRDIVRPAESYPLIAPASRLHLREMEKLVARFDKKWAGSKNMTRD